MNAIEIDKNTDELMTDILGMQLPRKNTVVDVRVVVSWNSDGEFVAIAKTKGDQKRIFKAESNTSKSALLELAALIVIKFPIEKKEDEIQIDIPTGVLVKTEVFKKWFDRVQKGDKNA